MYVANLPLGGGAGGRREERNILPCLTLLLVEILYPKIKKWML
jgi:hypothetical protein